MDRHQSAEDEAPMEKSLPHISTAKKATCAPATLTPNPEEQRVHTPGGEGGGVAANSAGDTSQPSGQGGEEENMGGTARDRPQPAKENEGGDGGEPSMPPASFPNEAREDGTERVGNGEDNDSVVLLDEEDEEASRRANGTHQNHPLAHTTNDEGPPVKRRREAGETGSPVPEDPTCASSKSVASAPSSSSSSSSTHPSSQQQPQQKPGQLPASSASQADVQPPQQRQQQSIAKNGEEPPIVTSYEALLDHLESYVHHALETLSLKENEEQDRMKDRKVLDVLLSAINILVQREPHSVRSLIVNKELVLPNTISLPPSQVVEMIVEHDPNNQLSRVVSRLFKDRLKMEEAERKDRQIFKANFPAPAMTMLLFELGQDLVKEYTYADIMHMRNLHDPPKDMEAFKQMTTGLRSSWEKLKQQNAVFHLKCYDCRACGFRTESRTVMSIHKATLHFNGRKYQCTHCPEFDTNENRITGHYINAHSIKPTKPAEEPTRVQCPICEDDFVYKGQRDQHLKQCRRDVNKLRTVQAVRGPEHINTINLWLWDKPPTEQSMASQQQQKQQQQQQAAAEQAKRQQQLRLQQQHQQQRQQLLVQMERERQLRQQQQQQLAEQQRRAAAIAAQQMRLKQQQQQQQNQQQQLHQAKIVAELLKRSAAGTLGHAELAQLSKLANIDPATLKAAVEAHLRLQHQQQRSQLGAQQACGATARQQQPPQNASGPMGLCEICDYPISDRGTYLRHFQLNHKQLRNKTLADMSSGVPLACSRCMERFWTYEGLERHLVMVHGLVTTELLEKAHKKEDGGRCKLCGKQFGFNMLQHLVGEHQKELCSAEIKYSCDVCPFKCSSYQRLETHLSEEHPNNAPSAMGSTPSSASTSSASSLLPRAAGGANFQHNMASVPSGKMGGAGGGLHGNFAATSATRR